MKRTIRMAAIVAMLPLTAGATGGPIPANLPASITAAPTLDAAAASLRIDLSAPMSADSIAVIAVYSNPDLIALRSREGVAEAQLFAAQSLPDPMISFGLDNPLWTAPRKVARFVS